MRILIGRKKKRAIHLLKSKKCNCWMRKKMTVTAAFPNSLMILMDLKNRQKSKAISISQSPLVFLRVSNE